MAVSTNFDVLLEFNGLFKGSDQGYDRVLSNIAAYSHLEEDQVRTTVVEQLTQSSTEFSLSSVSSGKFS